VRALRFPVIGADDEQATLLLRALYAPFLRNRDRMPVMDVRSAELTKYTANAMLATRLARIRKPGLRAPARTPLIFDGRNLYEPALLARHGFECVSIGRPRSGPQRRPNSRR
jgi:hypothetical protein